MDTFFCLAVGGIVTAVLLNLNVWKKFPVPDDGPDVNLLLLGKTGNGRSALGNNLLGRHEFESRVSSTPVTRHSRLERTKIGSRTLYVVDTPGLNIDNTMRETKETIQNLPSTFSPLAYRAFLIVMNCVNRLSQEDLKIIRFLEESFGKYFFEYAIFVFTHTDIFEARLRYDQNITEEFTSYIDNQPADMKDFIVKAGHRVIFVNSLDESLYRSRGFHVDLIHMVDNIRRRQNGKPYTRVMFEKARKQQEREITRQSEKEERLKREREDSIRNEALRDCERKNKQALEKLEQKFTRRTVKKELEFRDDCEQRIHKVYKKVEKEIHNIAEEADERFSKLAKQIRDEAFADCQRFRENRNSDNFVTYYVKKAVNFIVRGLQKVFGWISPFNLLN